MFSSGFFKKPDDLIVINLIDEDKVEKYISIKTFEEKFGITWLEHDITHQNMYQKLQIRYMGAILGWGLFAREDIQAGEIIGIFTGEVYFQDRHAAITSKHVFLSDAPNNQFQVVDATTCGNLTRFIQHLPTKEVLNRFFPNADSVTSKIATNNITHRIIHLTDAIVTEEYSAQRLIKAGEVLGSNYSDFAWLEKAPLFLEQDGAIFEEAKADARSDIPRI